MGHDEPAPTRLARWTKDRQATETLTERRVRRTEEPIAVRAETLVRLWSQPDDLSHAPVQHAIETGFAVVDHRRRAWITTCVLTALFMVFMEGSTTHEGPPDAISVIWTVFMMTLMGAWMVSAFRVATAFVDQKVKLPTLSGVARRIAEPLDYEDSVQWRRLTALTEEYIAMRGDLPRGARDPRVRPEAELVRYHLRAAAVSLRHYRAARDAVWSALGADHVEMSAVPALRGEQALLDTESHLEQAGEALEALRPLAVSGRMQRQMRPLSIPAPSMPSLAKAPAMQRRNRR
ncbi:hypothetical protein ACT17_06100 [Mycolicibacterium conceptionense]|uniref:Uncharacterized protein n=1 Tax=Mycolicibacterium conceptionense TaxID=451644 RepID=A0A0J8UGU5_9MYCO|nr:hypothetical protein [Mycolicibacterium conceptionense]KMV19615.1 hypothetical protein ACT17_06100 [Mycolicibacterium conceptionense]